MENVKLRLLALARFLEEETDELHPVSTQQLLAFLEKEGFSNRRQTLSEDMDLLEQFGLDIICQRVSNHYEYFLGSRTFETAELRMLIDTVQASPFLTQTKSTDLIKKLGSLGSRHQSSQLQHQVFVLGRVKNTNEQIFYSVDAICEAITTHKKISFQYSDWDVSGKKILRHDGKVYHVTPAALCVDKFYYLITYDPESKELRNFRVDRMVSLSVSSESSDPLPQHLDLSKHIRSSFDMYHGEETDITLEFHNRLLNAVMDRFGSDTYMRPSDQDHFRISTKVDLSPTFYSWLLCFGGDAKIISPKYAADALCQLIRESLSLYVTTDKTP